DFLAAQVAILLNADLLILLTDTDGLFSQDPSINPGAKLINEVSEMSEIDHLKIGHSGSSIGSGGMRSKVVAADMATSGGVKTVIANGFKTNVIQNIVTGELVGTHFHTQPNRVSSFKLWLRFAKPTKGILIVDAGAVKALTKMSTSLLAVGITDVQGSFD